MLLVSGKRVSIQATSPEDGATVVSTFFASAMSLLFIFRPPPYQRQLIWSSRLSIHAAAQLN